MSVHFAAVRKRVACFLLMGFLSVATGIQTPPPSAAQERTQVTVTGNALTLVVEHGAGPGPSGVTRQLRGQGVPGPSLRDSARLSTQTLGRR